MAIIKILKDEELVGGQDNTKIYPVTHTKAIYDGNNKQLDIRLNENDTDRATLHQQSEKMSLTFNVTGANPMEITGTTLLSTITTGGFIETFGDSANKILPDSAIEKEVKINDRVLIGNSYEYPNNIGSYKFDYKGTYNGITKYVSITKSLNIRKYFGFNGSRPTNPESLSTSNFSNSVGCTITVGGNSTGYKYVYLAVPQPMVISRVVQPDALNAPLSIVGDGTINRTINNNTYTYNLYRSTEQLDSSVSKRLTIS